MSTYNSKVHNDVGGDSMTVEAGGSIVVGSVTISADAAGNIIFTGLPTSDPAVAGALWSNTNVVTVSAG